MATVVRAPSIQLPQQQSPDFAGAFMRSLLAGQEMALRKQQLEQDKAEFAHQQKLQLAAEEREAADFQREQQKLAATFQNIIGIAEANGIPLDLTSLNANEQGGTQALQQQAATAIANAPTASVTDRSIAATALGLAPTNVSQVTELQRSEQEQERLFDVSARIKAQEDVAFAKTTKRLQGTAGERILPALTLQRELARAGASPTEITQATAALMEDLPLSEREAFTRQLQREQERRADEVLEIRVREHDLNIRRLGLDAQKLKADLKRLRRGDAIDEARRAAYKEAADGMKFEFTNPDSPFFDPNIISLPDEDIVEHYMFIRDEKIKLDNALSRTGGGSDVVSSQKFYDDALARFSTLMVVDEDNVLTNRPVYTAQEAAARALSYVHARDPSFVPSNSFDDTTFQVGQAASVEARALIGDRKGMDEALNAFLDRTIAAGADENIIRQIARDTYGRIGGITDNEIQRRVNQRISGR